MEEVLVACPLCRSVTLKPFLESQDYFLSKERFTIVKCQDCGFLFTNPRPTMATSGSYYQSDEYISHNSSQGGLMPFIYRQTRKFAIRRKANLVKRFSKGKELLDIGCGTGEFLAFCQKQGFHCTGIEPGEKARNAARENSKLTVWNDLFSMPDPLSPFGCITLWHVLEHIYPLHESMERIKQLLDPSGVAIVAVPNPTSWDAKKYGKYWAAYDLPRHIYHFTSDTILKLADKHGFTVTHCFPQKLDAYYISLLSEKYLSGKMNPLRSMLNGFRSNWHAGSPDRGYSSQIYLFTPKIV